MIAGAPAVRLPREGIGGRFEPLAVAGAAWALWSTRRARTALRRDGVDARVARPPRLPWRATRGVYWVAHRGPATCLERALVLQAWLAAHDHRFEVVIGVDPVEEFTAHAWLDVEGGDAPCPPYAELLRLPVPSSA